MRLTMRALTSPPPSDLFTWAYIECALWSSMDDGETQLDLNYDATDVATEQLERIQAVLAPFQHPYGESIC